MTVKTTADEKIESAKNHVKSAIKDLSDILVDNVWGWNSYNQVYQTKLQESLNALMNIKRDLES
ncbi:MAG: hypothetical protein WC389_16855 [Lutibacter sp.]|jgi:hypothetical protein